MQIIKTVFLNFGLLFIPTSGLPLYTSTSFYLCLYLFVIHLLSSFPISVIRLGDFKKFLAIHFVIKVTQIFGIFSRMSLFKKKTDFVTF